MLNINENTVTVDTIEKFRDSKSVGDCLRVVRKVATYEESRTLKKSEKAVLLAKYPHVAVTTSGDFTWTDLYFWENGRR